MWNLGLLGAAGIREGDFELIASTILASNEPSITFSNLGNYSSTYKHLQIRFTGRVDLAGSTSNVLTIRANGISTTSYSHHQLQGTGSVVEVGSGTTVSSMRLGRITAANGTTSSFGAGVIDILDPYSALKNTTFRSLTGHLVAGDNVITLFSGLFNNTASITQLDLLPVTSSNFIAGSRFSIYGVK
jgi:hypothetical protein